MTYYKVLDKNGEACHGGRGKWRLPKGDKPGAWMPTIRRVVACESGYHVCRRADLVKWLGPRIWMVEIDGDVVEESDKVVVARARLLAPILTWNDRTARLFAADCAARVLPIYEKEYPGDDRPRNAIRTTRAFARGEIDDAAWAAAWAWQAKRLFKYLDGELS